MAPFLAKVRISLHCKVEAAFLSQKITRSPCFLHRFRAVVLLRIGALLVQKWRYDMCAKFGLVRRAPSLAFVAAEIVCGNVLHALREGPWSAHSRRIDESVI
jgi:hypothetical protein